MIYAAWFVQLHPAVVGAPSFLFGEAARWNYPARYDRLPARARNVVAITTVESDLCVEHSVLEIN